MFVWAERADPVGGAKTPRTNAPTMDSGEIGIAATIRRKGAARKSAPDQLRPEQEPARATAGGARGA